MDMIINGNYNWRHRPDRLIYLGKKGNWHQFKKINDSRDVWCEVLDSDLHMLERTAEPTAPCGGCGEGNPDKRCIGCAHVFTTSETAKQELSPLEALSDFVNRTTRWQEGGTDRHAALLAIKALKSDLRPDHGAVPVPQPAGLFMATIESHGAEFIAEFTAITEEDEAHVGMEWPSRGDTFTIYAAGIDEGDDFELVMIEPPHLVKNVCDGFSSSRMCEESFGDDLPKEQGLWKFEVKFFSEYHVDWESGHRDDEYGFEIITKEKL